MADTNEIKVEKRPGRDWFVLYQFEDDPPSVMDVFGAMTIDEALSDAHSSLDNRGLSGFPSVDEAPPAYSILGIWRDDSGVRYQD